MEEENVNVTKISVTNANINQGSVLMQSFNTPDKLEFQNSKLQIQLIVEPYG